MSSPHILMTLLFRLEADRTEAICGLGRVAGAESTLAATDERLGTTRDALAATGTLYPLHMLARTCRLDDTDYLLLQMAMIQRHGVERVRRITTTLGDGSDELKLSHAVQLFATIRNDWDNVRDRLLRQRVFSERIVIERPAVADVADGSNPILDPGPAVAELMGWD